MSDVSAYRPAMNDPVAKDSNLFLWLVFCRVGLDPPALTVARQQFTVGHDPPYVSRATYTFCNSFMNNQTPSLVEEVYEPPLQLYVTIMLGKASNLKQTRGNHARCV